MMEKVRVVEQADSVTAHTTLSRGGSLTLSRSDVHVWCLPLSREPDETAALFSLLSPDERARAERFSFERHRNQDAVGRGLLRSLLGGYLGEEPSRIAFAYGPQGKPALAADGQRTSLDFNLSHSGDIAVYAFSRGRRLGVDLERIRPTADGDRFADRFFAPAESSLVRSLSGEPKLAAFFTIWTAGAILKASGDGLTKPANQTEVCFPKAARSVGGRGTRASRPVATGDLCAGSRLSAALAVEDRLGVCAEDGARGTKW
jgi:4'-phosphopantetheinyl transferase